MIAIFKKEWRAFFRSLRGYAILGAFAFLTGLFVTVRHLIYGSPAFEEVLALLSVGVAFLLPLLAIPLGVTPKGGEEELYALLPLTKREIYLGKYLFALSVLGLMTGVLAVCPLLLSYLTSVNLLSAYGSLLGFALLEHGILVGCLALSVTGKKRWVAYAISYGALAAAVALQAASGYLTGTTKRILETLSVFGAFSSLAEGRAEARTLILFLSLSALFGCLFWRRVRGRGRALRPIGIRVGVLSLVGALLLNGAALLIPAGAARLDLTESKVYSFSPENRELLRTLDRDVTLTVINADGSDRKLEAILQTADAASGHLSVRYATGEEARELLARGGVSGAEVPAYTLAAESERRVACLGYTDLFYYENTNETIVSFVNYYRSVYGMSASSDSAVRMSADEYAVYYGLLAQNESYAEYFEALVNESRLYFQGQALLALLEYVAADLIPREYILTGHGERASEGSLLGEMLTSFGEEAYTPLDLNTVGAIPEDASAVLMLMPTRDYGEEQIGALRAYLERGGTLTVVTGQSNLSDTPALMGLLSSYGLSATAETVWVETETKTEQTDTETGEPVVEKTRSDTVEVKIRTDNGVFASLAGDGSLAPAVKGGNAILMSGNGDPSLIHTPLLVSSASARLGESAETVGEYTLAAAAENASGARLVWFTGGESYAVSSKEYEDENIYDVYLLMLCAKWTDLVWESEVTDAGVKLYETEYLTVSAKAAVGFGIVTVFLIPLALVTAGWIIRYKRKRA